jgi:hypothetical protein
LRDEAGGGFLGVADDAIELLVDLALHLTQLVLELAALIQDAVELLVDPLERDELGVRFLEEGGGGRWERGGRVGDRRLGFVGHDRLHS